MSNENQAANILAEDAKAIEEMRHHIKVYLSVFGALAIFSGMPIMSL